MFRKRKKNFESLDKFSFKSVKTDEMKTEIFSLDDSEATQWGDIPAKILKESIKIYLVELTGIIKSSFRKGYFKMTEVFPIFKK